MKTLPLLALLAGCYAQATTRPGYYPTPTTDVEAAAPEAETEAEAPSPDDATLPATPADDQPKEYEDGQGTRVKLKLGDRAFADQVIAFQRGKRKAPAASQNPRAALGRPDRRAHQDERLGTTLGCRGSLTVGFREIQIYDGPGPDLHIFEVGDDVEAMAIEVSADNKTWIAVGEVRGQPASIDLAGQATGAYRFVRITDLATACSSQWPGADLDAVGAINAR